MLHRRRELLVLLGTLFVLAVGLLPPYPVKIQTGDVSKAKFRGEPTSFWREMLRGSDGTDGTIDFKRGTDAGSALPVLLELLNDPDSNIRRQAIYHIIDLGPEVNKAIEPLIHALADPDGSVQLAAARTLSKLDNQERIRAALVNYFNIHDDLPGRTVICECLWHLTKDANLVVSLLRQVLHDVNAGHSLEHDLGSGCRVVDLLAEIGPDAKSAVPDIIHFMNDQSEHWNAVYFGARALSSVGDQSAKVKASLRAHLSNNDPAARVSVARSLWELTRRDPDELIRVIISVIQTSRPDSFDCIKGIDALGSFGPEGRAAVPILNSILDDRQNRFGPESRSAASESLAKICSDCPCVRSR